MGSSAIIDDTTTDISDAMKASNYQEEVLEAVVNPDLGNTTDILVLDISDALDNADSAAAGHGSVGSSAIIDDPKSSDVAEAPGTCKFKEHREDYVESSIPKDDEIEHHVDLDNVIETETAVDPIAEIEASDHGLNTGISCKECGKLYMGPNKVFALMRHQVRYQCGINATESRELMDAIVLENLRLAPFDVLSEKQSLIFSLFSFEILLFTFNLPFFKGFMNF